MNKSTQKTVSVSDQEPANGLTCKTFLERFYIGYFITKSAKTGALSWIG